MLPRRMADLLVIAGESRLFRFGTKSFFLFAALGVLDASWRFSPSGPISSATLAPRSDLCGDVTAPETVTAWSPKVSTHRGGAVAVPSDPAHLPAAKAMPAAAVKAPPATFSW